MSSRMRRTIGIEVGEEDKEDGTLQQVMGPSASVLSGAMKSVSKFKFVDEGSPTKFLREFPGVADAYGVRNAHDWPVDKELTAAEQRMTAAAPATPRVPTQRRTWSSRWGWRTDSPALSADHRISS